MPRFVGRVPRWPHRPWNTSEWGAAAASAVAASGRRAGVTERWYRAFTGIKRGFLAKPDKSGAGEFDAGVAPLCAALNQHPGVFTTSSCAGRALLWLGDEPPTKKRGAPRLERPHVTHDVSGAGNLVDAADAFVTSTQRSSCKGPPFVARLGEDSDANAVASTVWLRFEPLLLHLCCRDKTTAQALVTAARAAGLKRTALSGPGPRRPHKLPGPAAWRLVVEGDDRLEMPLVVSGRRAFNATADPELDEWLRTALRRKFERNTERTRRLLNVVLSFVDTATSSDGARPGTPSERR